MDSFLQQSLMLLVVAIAAALTFYCGYTFREEQEQRLQKLANELSDFRAETRILWEHIKHIKARANSNNQNG